MANDEQGTTAAETLTRDDLLERLKPEGRLHQRTVQNRTVHIRELSSFELNQLKLHASTKVDDVRHLEHCVMVLALIATLVDDSGKPLFSEDDFKQVEQLPASLMSDLSVAITEVHRLDQENADAVGKSDATPS